MADSTTNIDINLRSTADTSGVEKMRSQQAELFDDLKRGVAETLSAGGADPKFISHVVDEFERLKKELQETGATGDEVVAKIVKLEQSLTAAAAAEEKRIRQLKVNFETALHEKDEEEEAAALQRRRREEDQLAMEREGILLKKNTELLEQQIMERLKAERVAKESVQTVKGVGTAMQGTKRDIAGATLTAAQFADDMQYGLRAVTNQIPQLAAALGLGTGVAGILGLAAVAVNLLWNKFGGAKEAKADTDKVTESLSVMKTALKNAGAAAEEVFKADLKTYMAEVDRLTGTWEHVAGVIQKVLGYHNDLAKVQTEIANHQLEIERQNALAGANTDEERKAVNTKFDARKAVINDASDIDQARRNLDAQQAHDELLRRQFGNVAAGRDDALGKVGEADKEQQRYKERYGGVSDQGRQVEAYDAALKARKEAQERFAALNKPGATAESTGSYEGEYEELEAKLEELHNAIAQKAAGIDAARKALDSGKGLSFEGLKKDADKAGSSTDAEEKRGAQGLAQAVSATEGEQKEIDAKRKAAEEAVTKQTQELEKIRQAGVESERQMKLLKSRLQAAELKDSESFAKAATAQVTADKEAPEKLRKQQLEEQARKLENDRKAAELDDDAKEARRLQTEIERNKLPVDASDEQRRAIVLGAQEREKQAQQKNKQPEVNAVADKATNLANNLGPAGAALKQAAAKLKDGATGEELQELLNQILNVTELTAQKFPAGDKLMQDFKKRIEKLERELRSQRL